MELSMWSNKLYYLLKPLVPRPVQIAIRSRVALLKRPGFRNTWPIDERAARYPVDWTGWPEKKQFALILTHDVDTAKGQTRCRELAELELGMGFRSSFNFVPEGYMPSRDLHNYLKIKGFEVGVHGLRHDGNLFASKEVFDRQAPQINRYLREWESVGFRSPCMYHNLEWIHDLDVEYDASTFDTDPFEPQPDGLCRIFPTFISAGSSGKGYVELPYTLPQDFTLFILLKEKKIDVWKEKLAWIASRGGMALVNTHPDYMEFDGSKPGADEYPVKLYEDLLNHIRENYAGLCWHVLPRDVARFWSSMFERGQETPQAVQFEKQVLGPA